VLQQPPLCCLRTPITFKVWSSCPTSYRCVWRAGHFDHSLWLGCASPLYADNMLVCRLLI